MYAESGPGTARRGRRQVAHRSSHRKSSTRSLETGRPNCSYASNRPTTGNPPQTRHFEAPTDQTGDLRFADPGEHLIPLPFDRREADSRLVQVVFYLIAWGKRRATQQNPGMARVRGDDDVGVFLKSLKCSIAEMDHPLEERYE